MLGLDFKGLSGRDRHFLRLGDDLFHNALRQLVLYGHFTKPPPALAAGAGDGAGRFALREFRFAAWGAQS
ncbi:MAG: hypothetical protein PWQ91_840 [Eubacteriales bacterium]|nr:hypothetical protein [Eubacteriales bacterium]MDN5363779.1 hypothetical protein [Eubacteriales bacterium]